MESKYWLRRKRDSVANAARAKSSVSRLIHLDLAGRYSIKAATAVDASGIAEPRVALMVPQAPGGDAEHYRQLETGARWLASRSTSEAERHEHLSMANTYARLRLDARSQSRTRH
jgi:hypothetical protein